MLGGVAQAFTSAERARGWAFSFLSGTMGKKWVGERDRAGVRQRGRGAGHSLCPPWFLG